MSVVVPRSRSTASRSAPPTLIERIRTREWTCIGIGATLIVALTSLALAPLALPASYSWVEHGTSEAAAQGVDGAWVARLGFLAFGVAVLWLTTARARAWRRLGTLFHVAFGVGMLGVAVFAARSWDDRAAYVASEDALHSAFAIVVGVGFVGGVLAVLVARRPSGVRGAVFDAIALIVAVVVPLLMSAGAWGVLQRAMFVVAALWYGREAWYVCSPPEGEGARR